MRRGICKDSSQAALLQNECAAISVKIATPSAAKVTYSLFFLCNINSMNLYEIL